MIILISAVLFFTETVFGGLGLGLEGAGLGLGLGLETTGLGLSLGLGTLVLTTKLCLLLVIGRRVFEEFLSKSMCCHH